MSSAKNFKTLPNILLAGVLVSFLVINLVPAMAEAQPQNSQPSRSNTQSRTPQTQSNTRLPNPLKATSIYTFITAALEVVLRFGSMLGALAIVFAGFMLVFARGNEEKIKEARKALTYSVVGTGVLLGAWTVAKIIENTINQISA